LMDEEGLAKAAVQSLERDGANPWMRAASLYLLDRASVSRAILLVKNQVRTEPGAIYDIARAQHSPSARSELLAITVKLGDQEFTAAAGAIAENPSLAEYGSAMFPLSLVDSKRPALLDGVLALEKGRVRLSSGNRFLDFHDDAYIQAHDQWLADVLAALASPGPPASKAPWLRLLRHFHFAKTADTILPALHAGEPSENQQAALEALRPNTDPAVAARIVKDWPLIAPSLRPALAALMVDRKEFRPALADALVSGVIKPGEITLDLEQRRELLRHSGDEIREKVSKFLTDDEYSNRAAVVDQWLAKLPATGDPANGKLAFQKLCFQCHRIGDLGHEVGPDLAAQSHRSVEDLLTHILDPDAAINPNYAAFLAETTDGQKHIGILISSSGANIVLRQPMALKVEIPREKLKSLQSTGHSLMPAGLEAAYTPQEMRDLIAFLQQK
jgi:putative heme-binding domain-containing protein